MWKDVKGYEDYFMVSDEGQVYSKRTGKVLKQYKTKTGYLTIATKIGGRNGKSVCFKVHRLVAHAFVDNPDDKPFINHKDGLKTNNTVGNLEWVTSSENMLHAHKTGLIKNPVGENNKRSKLDWGKVKYIRENYKPRHKTFGARALGRKFGVDKTTILNVVNSKRWKHQLKLNKGVNTDD